MTQEKHQSGLFVRSIIRMLARLYYPRIDVSDRDRIPATGPVLLVANHPNSLMDPVIIGWTVRRPVTFMAKAPLFEVPVLGPLLNALGMLPAYRKQDGGAKVGQNFGTLEDAAKALSKGIAFGIFPEGKTHDQPQLEMVRSGASRIAMLAVELGVKDLKIIPLGLTFEEKERFRSSAWVRVGEPIDAGKWLADHDNNVKSATRKLTKEIETRLKEVVIHLDKPEWEAHLEDLQYFRPSSRKDSKSFLGSLRQRKRIADAINYFHAKDAPKVEALADRLMALKDQAKQLGIHLGSAVLQLKGWPLIRRMIWGPILFVLFLGWGIAGTIHHLIPFLLVRGLGSLVKTPGRSALSLTRLGLGLPIYGIWYAGVVWWMSDFFRPWAAWTWFICMPFAGICALQFWQSLNTSFRPWFRQMVLLVSRGKLAAIRKEHANLCAELGELGKAYAEVVPDTTPQKTKRIKTRHWVTLGLTTILLMGMFALPVVLRRAWISSLPVALPGGHDFSNYSSATLDGVLRRDEVALAGVLNALDDLEVRATQTRDEFASGKRDYYNQADNDQVRRLMQEYIALRVALLRIIYKYQNYQSAPTDSLRQRAFLSGYTAATTLFEVSAKFVNHFNRSPETIKKLNEAEPLWDIPEGVYDSIRKNLASRKNQNMLEGGWKQYRAYEDAFAKSGLQDAEPYKTFHARIAQANKLAAELSPSMWKSKLVFAFEAGEDLGREAIYNAQSMISTWIGDTTIRAPRGGKTLMDLEKLKVLGKKLKPGDILLERRNWFLSNAFLPGYWPHAAVYIGTPAELKALGLDQHELIKPKWDAYNGTDAHHHPFVIIEALSEGIVFASLEHSIGGGDSVAVFRPKLPQKQINEAIAKAFSHHGKAYDFEFDFFSTDKIVCTELVYRAYDGVIDFPLVDIMGRKTLPATEIVRKFSKEYGQPDAQLEFIGFLDGKEHTGECLECDEATLIETLERPGMTWLQRD